MLKHSFKEGRGLRSSSISRKRRQNNKPISRGSSAEPRMRGERGTLEAEKQTQAASFTLDHSVHGPNNNYKPDCDDQGQGGAPVVANDSNIQERNNLRWGVKKLGLRNEQQSQCHLCIPP
jgi:hypothetical protein